MFKIVWWETELPLEQLKACWHKQIQPVTAHHHKLLSQICSRNNHISNKIYFSIISFGVVHLLFHAGISQMLTPPSDLWDKSTLRDGKVVFWISTISFMWLQHCFKCCSDLLPPTDSNKHVYVLCWFYTSNRSQCQIKTPLSPSLSAKLRVSETVMVTVHKWKHEWSYCCRTSLGKTNLISSSSAKHKMKPAEEWNVPHKASQTNTNTEFTNHLSELPSLTEAGSGRGAALGIINSKYIQAKEAVRKVK